MKYDFEDTIAAISTPPGTGGIGIIRMSGEAAVRAADKIFSTNIKRAAGSNAVARMSSHTLRHGYITDPGTGEMIDECIISVMKAPRSYTKEDVVEINCHGGSAVMRRILSLLFECGVRPAEPGEFTKRAFLNGRIDLSMAEAVMDIINAGSEAGRRAAADQLSGRLSREISEIQDKIKLCLAETEVAIDYPEYETEEDTAAHAMALLKEIKEKLVRLSETFYRGRIMKEGIKVAIAGIPNAGKSSLLNMLSGRDRAIVTDIPGTTRDTIEEYVDLDGIPVILTDTAGLRKTSDTVEKIGVDRTYGAIESSDAVLFTADISSKDAAERSLKLLNDIKERFNNDKHMIVLMNKSDIESEGAAELFGSDAVRISAGKEQGTEAIIAKIRDAAGLGAEAGGHTAIITSRRHKQLIDNALDALSKAEESYEAHMPVDCISYDLWECGRYLGEITGGTIENDVIETIFSKFCLGK